MFGKGVTLKLILDAIAESKNKSISLGTHHYVQLSESKELEDYDSDLLDSVELLIPAGAAVPAICEINWKKKCRNLKTVLNGYGQTEAGILTLNDNVKSLGKVVPGVQMKVRSLRIILLQHYLYFIRYSSLCIVLMFLSFAFR